MPTPLKKPKMGPKKRSPLGGPSWKPKVRRKKKPKMGKMKRVNIGGK